MEENKGKKKTLSKELVLAKYIFFKLLNLTLLSNGFDY